MACGTTDDARRGCLRCGACGHEWTATPDEIRKAGRADRAYAIEREAEAELELALARLPTREREINRRMLEAARRRPELSSAAQAELFGGES